MSKIIPGAFHLEYKGLHEQLRTEVSIFVPGSNRHFECYAIWDTGANESSISKDVIDHLKIADLKIGDSHVKGVATNNYVKRDAFAVGVRIQNSVTLNYLRVHDNHSLDHSENGMLIGMDVITQGNLMVCNYNSKTRFSFQYPALDDLSAFATVKKVNF